MLPGVSRLQGWKSGTTFGICPSLCLQDAHSHQLVAMCSFNHNQWGKGHFRCPGQLLSQVWSPKLTKVSCIIATVRWYYDLHDLEPGKFIDSQLWRISLKSRNCWPMVPLHAFSTSSLDAGGSFLKVDDKLLIFRWYLSIRHYVQTLPFL